MTRDIPRRTAFSLSQLGAVASRAFAQRVAELDLTPAEAGALRLLARNPGVSQRELAARLRAAPSRVVALLDSLEEKHLVTRRRSTTDRRNHEVILTDNGEAMMGRLRAVAEVHEASFLDSLSVRERDQLARLLAKLSGAHGLDPDVHPRMVER